MFSNMKARQLMNERYILDADAFVEIVVWQVPSPVSGSEHLFKYRLALVAEDVCVLRYDNEAGKGDHRHVGERQEPYAFASPEALLADFWRDVEEWRR